MADITLSKSVRSNLLNLQGTANLLATSQNRLSTGLRVNSAIDNPTNYFTAQGLNGRSNDLKQLQDSISTGIQTINEADKGLKAIGKLIDSAKAVVSQARQLPKTTLAEKTGSAYTAPASTSATDTKVTINGTAVTIPKAAAVGTSDTAEQKAASKDADAQRAVDAINAANTGAEPTGVTASVEGTVSGSKTIKLTSTADIVLVADATNIGHAAGTTAAEIVFKDANAAKDLQAQFTELNKQIAALARDASVNGVNLLAGDTLEVQFNEDNSSKLKVVGRDLTTEESLGLGDLSLLRPDGVLAAETTLKTATDSLKTTASKLGSQLAIVQTRLDFNKDTVNILSGAAADLTLADTNEEAANVLALQTRQQLSQQTLSLASQADQGVLRLF